jgi:hypothetical protein
VRDSRTFEEAMNEFRFSAEDYALFRPILENELRILGMNNCDRYRLATAHTEQWIERGRPR